MFGILWRLIKRVFVITPVSLLTLVGVIVALLMWLLVGSGCDEFEFPHEAWIGKMMDWADK